MKRLRIRVRTLLVCVAVLAVLIEVVGLGGRSRRNAARARAAGWAEQVNRNAARNSRLAAAQCLQEADRIAADDSARARSLRERAARLSREIPFFEAQAKNSARQKALFERAVTHPWEGDPAEEPRGASTPPAAP